MQISVCTFILINVDGFTHIIFLISVLLDRLSIFLEGGRRIGKLSQSQNASNIHLIFIQTNKKKTISMDHYQTEYNRKPDKASVCLPKFCSRVTTY